MEFDIYLLHSSKLPTHTHTYYLKKEELKLHYMHCILTANPPSFHPAKYNLTSENCELNKHTVKFEIKFKYFSHHSSTLRATSHQSVKSEYLWKKKKTSE